jgi:hypothetical protein
MLCGVGGWEGESGGWRLESHVKSNRRDVLERVHLGRGRLMCVCVCAGGSCLPLRQWSATCPMECVHLVYFLGELSRFQCIFTGF